MCIKNSLFEEKKDTKSPKLSRLKSYLPRSFAFLSEFRFLSIDDLCHQPIGISDGQIKDVSAGKLSAKNKPDSLRFLTPFTKTGCTKVDFVELQFGKPMTIKGIAFRSWSKINGMKMMYAFRDADPWVLVGKSVRGGTKPQEFRVDFDYHSKRLSTRVF